MYMCLFLYFGWEELLLLSHTYILLFHMLGEDPEAREEAAGGRAPEETASG